MPEWDAEVRVDETLARRLIRRQFPELEARSFRLLGEGWDTVVWLVDGEWVFRFPRRTMVISGLRNEIAHLPRLAPLLPLSIPVPTLVGNPADAFPWPFYGAPFLPGRELAEARLDTDARTGLGKPLAEFLRTLHLLDVDDELPVDPVRRADMTLRVPKTRERFEQLERAGLWTAPPAAHEVVDAAAALGPPNPTAVVHGDLHLRHLLVDDRAAPTAVIDWIDLSRNDPAVDFVLYWCALPPRGRDEFLETYGGVDDEQLLRARILSLFLCATLVLWGEHEHADQVKLEALGGLERTLTA